MGLGLLAVLCWVWVSFASLSGDQLHLDVLDAPDRGAFQPQSALSDMEFASVASYRGPGNSDRRSKRELPILLWWSGGLFPHFPGDTERVDCATSSCLVTSNRKVQERPTTKVFPGSLGLNSRKIQCFALVLILLLLYHSSSRWNTKLQSVL